VTTIALVVLGLIIFSFLLEFFSSAFYKELRKSRVIFDTRAFGKGKD
jgi:hypothetical protein